MAFIAFWMAAVHMVHLERGLYALYQADLPLNGKAAAG
jgi:hypothetical protein